MSTDCEMATFSWWLVQSDGKNRQILRLCSCSLLEPVLICCSCELLDGSPSLSRVMVTMHKIKTSPEINPAHLCLIDLDFQAANCSFSALELSRTSVFPTIVVKECRFEAGNQRSDETSVQSAMLRIMLKLHWKFMGMLREDAHRRIAGMSSLVFLHVFLCHRHHSKTAQTAVAFSLHLLRDS